MRQQRRRVRVRGCLLWLLGLVVVLLVLSLLFGGFQKGTKAGGAGAPAPVSVTAKHQADEGTRDPGHLVQPDHGAECRRAPGRSPVTRLVA
jgi:hypothetical protein